MKIRVNGETRTVGRIHEGKFYTHRNEDDHYVRKYDGFGLNKRVLDKLIERGIEKIIIIYSKKDSTQLVYKVKPSKWKNRGQIDKLGEFEKQVFLKLDRFDDVSGLKENKDEREKEYKKTNLNDF